MDEWSPTSTRSTRSRTGYDDLAAGSNIRGVVKLRLIGAARAASVRRGARKVVAMVVRLVAPPTSRRRAASGCPTGCSSAPTRPTWVPVGPSRTATSRTTTAGRPGAAGPWSSRPRRCTARTGPTSGHPWPRSASTGWAAVAAAPCTTRAALALASLGHTRRPGIERLQPAAPVGTVAGSPTRPPARSPRRWRPRSIAAVIGGFAAAAALAAASGLDGVEVDAGQCSLMRQFLSGLTNTRNDGFGTDRARLAREVLAATRAALGPDRCSGCGSDATSWPPGPASPPRWPPPWPPRWPPSSTTWWRCGPPPSTSGAPGPTATPSRASRCPWPLRCAGPSPPRWRWPPRARWWRRPWPSRRCARGPRTWSR